MVVALAASDNVEELLLDERLFVRAAIERTLQACRAAQSREEENALARRRPRNHINASSASAGSANSQNANTTLASNYDWDNKSASAFSQRGACEYLRDYVSLVERDARRYGLYAEVNNPL